MIFWSERAKTPPPKVKATSRSAQKHPFADTGSAVKSLLQKLIDRKLDAKYRSLTLWLPTGEFVPQPSPQLVHDWEVDGSPFSLAQWTMRGVWLPAVEAFEVLMALSNRDEYPPTVRVADECYYWQVASRMVLEALAQQKIRPGLEEVAIGQKYEARWHPVLDGPKDGPRLAQLKQAMPPICRADAPDPAQTLPVGAVLDSYLNIMTDALARQWGAPKQPSLAPGQQTVGDNWVRALFDFSNRQPTIQGAVAAIHHAQSSYRAWLRNLYVAGPKEYRVTFQLEAPVGFTGEWELFFLLQARDDPSLLVPAKEVWKTRRNTLNMLNRYFKQPQETMLTALGYSARFFQPVQRALETAKPKSVTLNPEEAHNFLRECAPLLEQSGFGVLVPPWWNKPGARLGVRLKMSSSSSTPADVSSGIVGFDNLVKYRWEVSIGDMTLTREEFDALVNLKSPLVQVRGQWVQLDPEQIEAAIRFWDKQAQEAEIGLLQALQLGLGAAEEAQGLPVEGVELDGWLSDWIDQLNDSEKLEILPSPHGLDATLRPYQEYGYSWLSFMHKWGMGALLADSMGLGKTIQTLTMLLRDKEQEVSTGPVLLICPTSVVTNWEKEAKRFTPDLTTVVHQGPKRLRGKKFIKQAEEVDMVLTSYALARRDEKALAKVNWYGVILDEAQNIKNSQTKQAQVIRRLPAGFRLALTGTPIENRLSELWSIMQFLNPGYLGSRKNFRDTFILPIEKEHDQVATDRLRRLTEPFILRRLKTDPTVIQDLPEKLETKVYCHLTKEQATLYEAVVQDALVQVEDSEGIQRQGLVLSMLMKLKQICNHPGQFLHQFDNYKPSTTDKRSGKLMRLTQMLEEIISQGDRVLIFTQFAKMGGVLKSYLQTQLGVGTQFLHGGVPGHKRETLVKRFQEDADGPPIFILSIKAGGTGLNLTRANHVFHFDRWWNPAVEDQATDRAFRIGQKKNVLVHKFVCVGTVEEQIDQMIESKKALAESIVGQKEEWLTEMSTDQLREIVTLRREIMA
ncbi:MAG: DEAD/DEAH box helicase [Ardenticatenaceae bacterium]